MLDFRQFDRIAPDIILYAGEYMYYIILDANHSLTVHVEDLDDNGDAYTVETYAASNLSTAVAILERLEAGEAE